MVIDELVLQWVRRFVRIATSSHLVSARRGEHELWQETLPNFGGDGTLHDMHAEADVFRDALAGRLAAGVEGAAGRAGAVAAARAPGLVNGGQERHGRLPSACLGGSIVGCTLPLRHTSMKKAGGEQCLELAGRSVAQRRMEPLLVVHSLDEAA